MHRQFKHPEKWRNTIDPFSLNYHTFRPTEVLGYPHAGNDVFHVKGIYNDTIITAYIKAARQHGAAIENEVAILRQFDLPIIPRILDADLGKPPFCVTSELPGLRLSIIVGENENMLSLSYMEEYGETLSRLHSSKITAAPVADRRFFHTPSDEMLEKLGLSYLKHYFANAPTDIATVFCHGDFHYANLLWHDHHISGILDFELSGYGNRDFDIAWSLICRPGQKFLRTEKEQNIFLSGYSRHGSYSISNIRYYMAQIYVYFLSFSSDDPDYCNYVRTWLQKNCQLRSK